MYSTFKCDRCDIVFRTLFYDMYQEIYAGYPWNYCEKCSIEMRSKYGFNPLLKEPSWLIRKLRNILRIS